MKTPRIFSILLLIGMFLSFSVIGLAAGNPPSQASVQAVPVKSDGIVSPMVNDNAPWWANAKSEFYSPSRSARVRSFSRTATNDVRDIDYISATTKFTRSGTGGFTISKTDYDTNGADAYVLITIDWLSGDELNSTHYFKEEGYNDITLYTYKKA